MAKQSLGKGLGALIKKQENATAKTSSPVDSADQVKQVPLNEIVPSPLQPRLRFGEEPLDELVESIRQHGIIQPLIVRRVGETLELIAGERRWRASTKLGLSTAPVIIREASDQDVLEMALIENLQRQDLNAIEEAAGYVRLAKEFSLKQEDIAKRVGKSRAAVANAMRLMDLCEDVQRMVAASQLTVGHAKAILGLKDAQAQKVAATQVIAKQMTVRATEKFVQDFLKPNRENAGGKASAGSKSNLDPETASLIKNLQSHLRTRYSTHVSITHSPKKGKIELEYYGNDDLDRILDLMGITPDIY